MTHLEEFTFPARYPQTLGVMERLPDPVARGLDQCSFCRHPLVPPAYTPGPGLVACLECAEAHARDLEAQALASQQIAGFLFDNQGD